MRIFDFCLTLATTNVILQLEASHLDDLIEESWFENTPEVSKDDVVLEMRQQEDMLHLASTS